MTTSVALCTYNGEEFLSLQLDSILNQTVMPDEIVICDDVSDDSTIKTVLEYQKKFPIIKLFQNEQNLGFIKNFEKAIYNCTKEVIIISDQDDTWEIDKVETVVSFLQKNESFDGVFHDMNLIDEHQTQPSYLNWKSISHEEISLSIKEGRLLSMIVSKGSFILGCALSIRKESIKKYDIKNFPYAHDLFIAQKLSAYQKLGFIPKTLSNYRLHANQVYGLRYQSENKEPEKLSTNQHYFKEFVWANLNVVKKHEELRPQDDVRNTQIFSTFIRHRNSYLGKLPFVQRKVYIAKCARHQYLYLNWLDLFKF